MSRYLRILQRPGARWLFLTAIVARLPVAMGPLGMVIEIQQVRGTYAIAGLVTAAYAAGGAIGAPLWGRLMDRRGQSLVIGVGSALSALLLGAVALGAVALGAVGGWGDGLLAGLAGGSGLAFPPVSSAVRGAWREVLPLDVDRRAAYALDAVAVETIFVAGPLILSLLIATAPPAVPLLVTAALLLTGGAGYAASGAVRRWRPEPAPPGSRGRGRSPLREASVVVVLVTAVLLAVGFGLADVSIAATARETLGSQARVGLLFAAIAGGSAIGGLWYGSRAWKGPEHRRLPVALAGYTTGLSVTTVVLFLPGPWPPLAILLPVLFATGLCIAPGLIVLGNLIDHHGSPDRLGEAQAWLATAFTSGSAVGTALAGLAVDRGGPPLGFTGAAVAVAVAAMAAALAAGVWRGSAVAPAQQ